jgi:hypothetical protein
MFAAFNAGSIKPQGDRRLVGPTTIEETIQRFVPRGIMAIMPAS